MSDFYRLGNTTWEPVVRYNDDALFLKWKWNVRIVNEYQTIPNRVKFLFTEDKASRKESTAKRKADWYARYECEDRFRRQQARKAKERQWSG